MDEAALPQTLPVVGDEIAGKYRIDSVLGQGGMGAVFSAKNLLTGKRVAIKWLLPEQATDTSRERLLREARIAAAIDHPNIVDIYDVGTHGDGLFLVMEYLRGRSLADVLAIDGRLHPGDLIAWLIPAMRGVHAAHQAGVVHRDLKPENILLSEVDGRLVPKVLDFGVSKAVGPSAVPSSSLTRTGALVGTPHYMALEQVDGSGAVDPRTDVYAFGVILYRTLTGYFPFDGSTLGEVILKIGTKDPVLPSLYRPDLPVSLDHVILRAMARQREARYESLPALVAALEPFANPSHLLEAVTVSGSVEPRLYESSTLAHHGKTPLPHGKTPFEQVPAHGQVARPTPEIEPHKIPARAFMIGAVCGLALLVGLALYFVNARSDTPALVAPNVPHLTSPAAGVGASAEPALPAHPPEAKAAAALSQPPGEDARAAHVEARGVAREQSPDGERRLVAPTATAVTSSTSPPETSTVGPARERAESDRRGAPLRTPRRKEPTLIPGDRTHGLSADDF